MRESPVAHSLGLDMGQFTENVYDCSEDVAYKIRGNKTFS